MTNAAIAIAPYSAADIENIIPIHLAAFEGYMNARLGKKYARAFLGWFLTYPNSIALKAELDGTICGYALGAPIGYIKFVNRDLFLLAAFSILANPGVILHENFVSNAKERLRLLVGRRASNVSEKDPEGKGLSFVAMGVAPQFSGLGVAQALEAEFLERARAIGMDYVRGSVYDWNKKVRHIHEKSGFQALRQTGNVVYYFKFLD